MGTNYYTHVSDHPCPTCGSLGDGEKHIGKSSSGWQFVFQEQSGIKTRKDWFEYLKDKRIIDEYGEVVPVAEFWDLVEEKQSTVNPHVRDPHWYTDADGYRFCNGDFT